MFAFIQIISSRSGSLLSIMEPSGYRIGGVKIKHRPLTSTIADIKPESTGSEGSSQVLTSTIADSKQDFPRSDANNHDLTSMVADSKRASTRSDEHSQDLTSVVADSKQDSPRSDEHSQDLTSVVVDSTLDSTRSDENSQVLASMVADSTLDSPRSDGKSHLDYWQLLQPRNKWALNFILTTCCLDPRLSCEINHMIQLPPELKGLLLVGSTAQNLTLSSLESLSRPREMMESMSDKDFIEIFPVLVVDPHYQCNSADNQALFGFSETTGTQPGYLRIVLSDNNPIKQYFKQQYVPGMILTELSMVPNSIVHEHGPGSTVLLTSSVNAQSVCADVVAALKCPIWPAADWSERERPSGWPSEGLIEKIVSKGCHIVSKPHPSSCESDAEIEFRYSFSVAEVDICRVLCDKQKQCFLLYRLAVMNALKGLPSAEHTLSSYYLKTVLWWVCEELPSDKWTRDTIGSRLMDLIDKLLEFLLMGNIPNYFIPENNMISHFPGPVIHSLIKLVEGVRSDPVCHLFSSVIILQCKPDKMFQPLMDILPRKNTTTRLEAIVRVLLNGVRSASNDTDFWRRGYHSYDTGRKVRILGVPMPLSSFMLDSLMKTYNYLHLPGLENLAIALEKFAEILHTWRQTFHPLLLLRNKKLSSPKSEALSLLFNCRPLGLSVFSYADKIRKNNE